MIIRPLRVRVARGPMKPAHQAPHADGGLDERVGAPVRRSRRGGDLLGQEQVETVSTPSENWPAVPWSVLARSVGLVAEERPARRAGPRGRWRASRGFLLGRRASSVPAVVSAPRSAIAAIVAAVRARGAPARRLTSGGTTNVESSAAEAR